MKTTKMRVEIWSDITCNFCYAAKRSFEKALSQFKNRDHVEVVWRSFELAPDLKTDVTIHLPQFLANLKGISLEQAQRMTNYVVDAAKELGLEYNLNQTIPANSFNAHRLSHWAKDLHLQNETKEILFKAYFTDGKNIDDVSTLAQLAEEIGLNIYDAKDVLRGSKYIAEVREDIIEAKELGITSVPFFQFNKGITISGAQSSDVFLDVLQKAFDQWQHKKNVSDEPTTGALSCGMDGDCQ